MDKKKVLIIRNFASEVNTNSYNLQEIGLGKSFVRKGYDCDVVYYNRNYNFDEEVYSLNGIKLTIKWNKAFKIMNNSIFYRILKKSFLKNYDIVISTEYNQIMSFLLSIYCKDKIVLYHGPYHDIEKKLIQRLYDFCITPFLKRNIKSVLTKSDLAKDYLESKGFKNIETVGVGLDIEAFKTKMFNEIELLNHISNQGKYLLYIGVLEDRRNIQFLLGVLKRLISKDNSVKLVLIGNGKAEDKNRYFETMNNMGIQDHVIYIEGLPQYMLQKIYSKMDLFVFPTKYDIFGMVLLESMYFGLPVVSSFNGGSQTLINKSNGVVLKKFDEELWADTIFKLLLNEDKLSVLGRNASKQIEQKYIWDKIVEKFIRR